MSYVLRSFVSNLATQLAVRAGNDNRPELASRWRCEILGDHVILKYRAPARIYRGVAGATPYVAVLDGYLRAPAAVDSLCDDRGPIDFIARQLIERPDSSTVLCGHFSLSIVDLAAGKLLCFRDRLGARTLYWRRMATEVRVASEVEHLLDRQGNGASMRENQACIAQSFSLRQPVAPGPTANADIREILPGSALLVTDGKVEEQRIPFNFTGVRTHSAKVDWVHRFHAALFDSVSSAIGEHQRVAVMLSGGLDSVPLFHVACGIARERNATIVPVSWALPTFPECDEAAWIRMAAESEGIIPRIVEADSELPLSRLSPDQIRLESPAYNAFRPLVETCYRQAAVAGCTVLLTGNQGDVLYASRFLALHDALRRFELRTFRRELSWIVENRSLVGAFGDPAVRYLVAHYLRRGGPQAAPRPWLVPNANQQLPASQIWPPESKNHPYPSIATTLLGVSMTQGPAEENLFARRFGIDRREPYQDEALVRLMLAAPIAWSQHRGETKRIMREAMRGRIPEALRTKSRTGVLTGFMRAGFNNNREAIRQFLFDTSHCDWTRYVKTDWLAQTLAKQQVSEIEMMVVVQCIGYSLWIQEGRRRAQE